MTVAQRERAALVATFRDTAPDERTLCEAGTPAIWPRTWWCGNVGSTPHPAS